MTGRFACLTVGLTACVSFLVGMVVTGSLTPSTALGAGCRPPAPARDDRPPCPALPGSSTSPTSPSGSIRPSSTSTPSRSRAGRRRADQRERAAASRGVDDPFDYRRRGADAAPRRRHRLPHRRRRAHPHQPPRHRGRRAPHRQAGRRPEPAGRRHRLGSGTDIALIKIDVDGKLPHADARRLRRAACRRMGLRHRQPAGLRAHRHRRGRQLHRPQAVRHEPRQLHPDRRGDQLRQQRRAADQRARRGDWHQLRHQPSGEQHRVRRADQPGQAVLPQLKERARVSAATSAWRCAMSIPTCRRR